MPYPNMIPSGGSFFLVMSKKLVKRNRRKLMALELLFTGHILLGEQAQGLTLVAVGKTVTQTMRAFDWF
jgi:hypothetical protein